MKKQLTRIAVLKTGVFLGTLYGVISLIFVLPVVLTVGAFGAMWPHTHYNSSANALSATFLPSVMGAAVGGGFALLFTIVIPFFYALIGFISGIVIAAVYNLISKWTGGLEFEVRDLPQTSPSSNSTLE